MYTDLDDWAARVAETEKAGIEVPQKSHTYRKNAPLNAKMPL